MDSGHRPPLSEFALSFSVIQEKWHLTEEFQSASSESPADHNVSWQRQICISTTASGRRNKTLKGYRTFHPDPLPPKLVSTLAPCSTVSVTANFDGTNVHLQFGILAGFNGTNGTNGSDGAPGEFNELLLALRR